MATRLTFLGPATFEIETPQFARGICSEQESIRELGGVNAVIAGRLERPSSPGVNRTH